MGFEVKKIRKYEVVNGLISMNKNLNFDNKNLNFDSENINFDNENIQHGFKKML